MTEPMMAVPDFLTLLDRPRTGTALQHVDRSVDYAELGHSVWCLADALVRQGVSVGDRVAVMLSNTAAAVELYLACARLGAIWVGLNPGAPEAERDRQCALVQPRLIVTAGGTSWTPSCGRVVDSAALYAAAVNPYQGPLPDLDQPCAIGFSSGTTGTPKAIVHSRQAVSLTAAVHAAAGLQQQDRVGVILPLSIHNLMIVGAVAVLFAGATCVPLERMNAAAVASACAELRLTLLTALVPATIYDLVRDTAIEPSALSTLRYAGTGAAGLAETLRDEFEQKFGTRLIGSYGMTEAPAVVCTENPTEVHRDGSSGTALPHVEVLAQNDSGEALPPRREGELIVRPASSGVWAGAYRPAMGAWTADGLLRRPPADGVLRTGDYGWIDHDGSVHVTGRKADVLIRGGVNVNAAELEFILGQLPAVRDVAVVGEADERLGQRIVAYAELTSGAMLSPDGLREQARGVLAHGKVPDLFVVGPLPRNAMGKVARAQLCR